MSFFGKMNRFARLSIRCYSTPSSSILNERALAKYNEGIYGEAISLFKESLEVTPQQPDAVYNIATCHLLNKEWKEATVAYEETLQLDPKHTDSMINLGNLYASHLSNPEKVSYQF
jgi:tetratricopeptide (TPR) repeat protein